MSAGPARAQESGVAEAREKARAAPASHEAALGYATALRRAGRENEALTELRRAIAMAGGRVDVVARLQWEVARTHIAKREFESAMGTCRAISPKIPTPTSRICVTEAHLLWRRGSEALAELAELAKTSGAPAEVQYFAKVAEGRAQELASKDAEAEKAFRDAIGLAEGRPDAHVQLGLVLKKQGKDGVPSLRRAVQIDARDPIAQLELGRALPKGSAESIAALERAVAERPTFTDALRALAEGYVAANRLADAKKTVAEVIRLAPNDAVSKVVAGRLALAEGRTDDALKEGEAAGKLMPNLQPAKLLVADVRAKQGEIDLAVEAYQAAFFIDRLDPTPLVNASQACLAAGRVTSAKAFGVRATQDFASHGPGWLALGDALAADKDVAGAKTAYEKARNAKDVDVAAVDRKLAKLR
ncbi:MAG: tetratricopeptide repeat protein [Deltaproteobacteria bacterium]|nr:tetratricopeptide repeat protein [Deltaproteobacteria bacterium]